MEHKSLESAQSVITLLVTVVAWIGLAAFFSLWIHRSEGNRALTMGLYIVFGALAWFGFLYGLGSNFRNYREGGAFFSEGPTTYLFAGLAAGLVLIPPSRRLLAKIIPFDPGSKPEMVGLVVLLIAGTIGLVTTFFDPNVTTAPTYIDLATQILLFVVLAVFAVGLWVKRSPRETLDRLGVTRPTARQIGAAVALVAVALVVSTLSSALLQWLQPGVYNRVENNLETLTSNITSIWGAVLLGLFSATGEELLFRGAIQPRYGVVFTSLVFALLHVQYDPSFVVFGVFATGIVFGLERKYLNTSSSIITHAAYNTIAVLLSM